MSHNDDEKKGRALEKAFAEVEDKIKTERDWYETKVDQQAKLVCHKYVKPFCLKRGLRFVVGNGTWVFVDTDRETYHKERPLEDTEEWDRLMDLLAMEVPGMDGNDLGSLMEDWPKKKEEKDAG